MRPVGTSNLYGIGHNDLEQPKRIVRDNQYVMLENNVRMVWNPFCMLWEIVKEYVGTFKKRGLGHQSSMARDTS